MAASPKPTPAALSAITPSINVLNKKAKLRVIPATAAPATPITRAIPPIDILRVPIPGLALAADAPTVSNVFPIDSPTPSIDFPATFDTTFILVTVASILYAAPPNAMRAAPPAIVKGCKSLRKSIKSPKP